MKIKPSDIQRIISANRSAQDASTEIVNFIGKKINLKIDVNVDCSTNHMQYYYKNNFDFCPICGTNLMRQYATTIR